MFSLNEQDKNHVTLCDLSRALGKSSTPCLVHTNGRYYPEHVTGYSVWNIVEYLGLSWKSLCCYGSPAFLLPFSSVVLKKENTNIVPRTPIDVCSTIFIFSPTTNKDSDMATPHRIEAAVALSRILRENGVEHAYIDGLAVNLLGYQRTTDDIDIEVGLPL